jgi:hypothetical protein
MDMAGKTMEVRMRMNRTRLPVVLCALTVLVSCASVQLVTRAERAAPPYKDQLARKSIGIMPFNVSFGASRFVTARSGITVTSADRAVQLPDRFLAKDTDDRLGDIGILDVDILTKSKTDAQAIQQAVAVFFKAGLAGTLDYHIGFFKSLGEDTMGELSNRPIQYDRSVYPPRVTFMPAAATDAFYTDVRVLGPGTDAAAAGTDLELIGDVSISSEVVELLSIPPQISIHYQVDPTAKAPSVGDYYLTLRGSMRFRLIDVKTGAVIATEKSRREWPVKDIIADTILIPASRGDAAAYARYFRSASFTPMVIDAVKKALPSMLPLVAPYYVNTTHQVAAEK